MSRVSVQSERVIDAQPEAVFDVLSDYKNKRPLILTPNFQEYEVEKGGKGAGTQISYRLYAANRDRQYRMSVDEAIPGERLTERDKNSSLVTTWLLQPEDQGRRTRVRVLTQWEGTGGVKGFFERTFAPLGLRRIYGTMLDLLALVVQPAGTTRENLRSDRKRIQKRFLLLSAIMSAIYVVYWYRRYSLEN